MCASLLGAWGQGLDGKQGPASPASPGWLHERTDSSFSLCRPCEVLHADHAQPFQVSVLISQVRRSSCFLSSRLCVWSCTRFLVSLHSNPQGCLSCRAPHKQGTGPSTLANISKEELLGRLSLAQRKERKLDTPILESTGTRPAQGSGEQRLYIYLLSTPTFFLPLLVCSKFKFPRSNWNWLSRFNMVCIIFKHFRQQL